MRRIIVQARTTKEKNPVGVSQNGGFFDNFHSLVRSEYVSKQLQKEHDRDCSYDDSNY
jgi:hypothetical protein